MPNHEHLFHLMRDELAVFKDRQGLAIYIAKVNFCVFNLLAESIPALQFSSF